eukprot:gb/GECG01002020.1/.p1 GENE.gb/GECG01002020.1/~~gb/GECG01002020.1/.p1  ORF type:complete len:1966 (+),score=293.18 gb/GECG01002020.1/:1-5898(+)
MFSGRSHRASKTQEAPSEADKDENRGRLYRNIRVFAIEGHNLQRKDGPEGGSRDVHARTVARVAYKDQLHVSDASERQKPNPVYENFDCVLRDVNPDDQDYFLLEIHEKHTFRSSIKVGSARVGIGEFVRKSQYANKHVGTKALRVRLVDSLNKEVGQVTFAMSILSEEEEDQMDEIDDREIPNVLTTTVVRSSLNAVAAQLNTADAAEDPEKLKAYVLVQLGDKEMPTSVQKRMERSQLTQSEWLASSKDKRGKEDDDVSESGSVVAPEEELTEVNWQWTEDIRFPCKKTNKNLRMTLYVVPASWAPSADVEEPQEQGKGGPSEAELRRAAKAVGEAEVQLSRLKMGEISNLALKSAHRRNTATDDEEFAEATGVDEEAQSFSEQLGSIDLIASHFYDPNPPHQPESNAISVSPQEDEGDVEVSDPGESRFEESHRKSKKQHAEEQKRIEEAESINMKEGDYSVIVHIIEARELKSAASKGCNDPVVHVKVNNQEEHTKTQTRRNNAVFDHTMYFSLPKMTRDEIESTTINISAYDGGFRLRNGLIGMYQFDASSIYYMEHHEFHERWVGLTDPTSENARGIQGFMKLSVIVLGEGEKRHNWEAEPEEDPDEQNADGLASMVMLPPSVEVSTHFLIMKIYRAWGLPAMDQPSVVSKGGIDAYCQVNFGGNKPLRTKWHTVKPKGKIDRTAGDLRVEWHEEMVLPYIEPSMSNTIELSVWDHNRVNPNQRVGSIILDLRQIKEYQEVGPVWLPIYGAPDGVSRGADAKMMNRSPHLASNYRGRLLVSFKHDPDENQELPEKATVSKMKQRLPWQLSPPMRKPQLTMKALVISGDSIPKSGALQFKSKEYRIVIECGGQMCSTHPVALGRDLQAHWYQSLQMGLEVPTAPDKKWERRVLPDTFVYLCRGDPHVDKNRICYARFSTLQLLELGFEHARTQWVPLTADPVIDQVRGETDPGTVLMRVAIGETSVVDESTGDWDLELEEAKDTFEYQIRLHCYQGRDLPAVDSNGSIDPFVRASICGITQETKDISQCSNPQWYQTLVFDVSLPNFRFAPQIKVQLYDKEYVGQEYVSEARFSLSGKLGTGSPNVNSKISGPWGSFGGMSELFEEATDDGEDASNASEKDPFQYTPPLDLSDVSSMRPRLLDPQWYGLARHGVFGGKTQGELLLGFQVVRKSSQNEIVPNIPRTITPVCEEWLVEIVVLGLRDMRPYKFLPSNNPQVGFDVGKRERKGDTKYTQHSKKPSGSNPNYFQRLLVPVDIPINPLFAPSMGVSVQDSRFGGLWRPTLGTASVSLSSKIPWSPDYDAKTIFRQQQKLQQAATSLSALGDVSESESEDDEVEEESPEKETPGEEKDTTEQNGPGEPTDDGTGTGLATADQESKNDDPESEAKNDPEKPKSTDSDSSNASLRSYDPDRNLIKRDGAKGEKDEDVAAYMKKRPIYSSELEEILGDSCFDSISLKRGKEFGHWFSNKSSLRSVGILKGVVRLIKTADDKCPLDLRTLLSPRPFVIRVYVMEGKNLSPQDSHGKADPYVHLKLGKTTVSDKKNYVKQELCPEVYRCYEIQTMLPGESRLTLGFYDYDLLRDQLIGETNIDLEDRWFDENWKSMGEHEEVWGSEKDRRLRPKPVETRFLWHPTSKMSQGSVRLWVDILSAHQASYFPAVNIERPPPAPFEVRLVVWRAKDVPSGDGITNMNDLYCRAMLQGAKNETLKTDTHWRAQNGKASFNWRMKWKVHLPMKFPYLTLQLWDKDIFKYNDCLAETQLSLKEHYMRARKQNTRYIVMRDKAREEEQKKKKRQEEGFREEKPVTLPMYTPTGEAYESDEEMGAEVDKELKSTAGKRQLTDREKVGEQERQQRRQKKQEAEQTLTNLKEMFGMREEVIPENAEWLSMHKTEHTSGKMERVPAGNLLLSMEILPLDLAQQDFHNGSGRSEPNVHPYLPPPAGRMKYVREACHLAPCLACCF